MRNGILFMVLLVIATGAIMAGGNMDNKIPTMIIVGICAVGMLSLAGGSRARR